MSSSVLWRRVGLVSAFVCAAALFFLFGVVFRLLMGPVSLGPFGGELRGALRQVLPGLELRFDEAALEWSPDEGRVNLVVLGTRVFDRSGRIIAQAPKAEIGLAAGPFLFGDIVVRRIALVGVQLTLVHAKDGTLRLGVERDNSRSDVLQQIRDAIAKGEAGGNSSLKSFAVHKARLAFFDEETGAFIVAPEAELQIANGGSASTRSAQSINAAVDAQLEISGKRAHLLASVNLPRKGEAVTGDVSLTGLSVAALAANAKSFGFLAPFAVTADVSGSFTVDHGTSLGFADFGIGATGFVNGLGKPMHVKSMRIVGRYDGATHRLLIDDGTLEGEQTRAHLAGSGNLTFDESDALARTTFELTVDKVSARMPGVMAQAVTLARAAIRGNYTPSSQHFVFDQAVIFGGPLSATFAGDMTLVEGRSPAIVVDGKVNAIAIRDMLHFWPLLVGQGARDWIDANVSAGRIGPMILHANIPAGALDQVALPDDALSLTFPVEGATITYIRGLTPATNVMGEGMLHGDTFKAELYSATIGPLSLTDGHAVIPNLHQRGAPGDMSARVRGSLPDVLALTDMKPLQYATRFHINAQSAKGGVDMNLALHVPMLKSVTVDNIGISIKAATTGLALSLGPHTALSNGALNFDIGNSSLHAAGTVELGSANLAIDWLESFKATNPITTHLTLRGTLDDSERAALNLHLEKILSGPVGIVADLEGHRGSIQRAQLGLDLTPATLAFDLINIRKPPGTAASAQVAARLDAGGNVKSASIALTGANLAVKGNAIFGPAGDLQHLDLPVVRAGAVNDFGLSLNESPASGLDIAITGHALDGTALGRRNPDSSGSAKTKPAESTEPFHASARLDRIVLRDSMTLAPFALDMSGVGQRARTLSLTASLTKTVQVSASITNGDSGRRLTLASNDAGLLLRGLFGFESMKGGQLTLNAALPPITAASRANAGTSDYSGQVIIRDFKVVNQAFLTRLFSAGSLGGFVDLMRGQGIAVDTFQLPFRVSGDVIDIHDARASGPSIGITADGYLDRLTNRIALQGAMAPLFGINSVLGAIPVLGNVFVSKKGEGLFGVTYSVSGDADQPQIAMNPLSMLAPGILRRIFQGATPSAPAAQANTNVQPAPDKPQ